MDPERLDLSALDLLRDVNRHERLVAAIMERAAPELARRAAGPGTIDVLAGWMRPTIAAAAMVAIASAAALLSGGREAPPAPVGSITEALGVPAPVNAWILGDRDPTVSDVLIAIEGE